MTSVANYLVNTDNMLEEYNKKIPVYEHSGIHTVLKKIIGNDRILMENNSNGKKFKGNFKFIFMCNMF